MNDEVKAVEEGTINVINEISNGNFWETYGSQITNIGNHILACIIIVLFGYLIKKLLTKLIDRMMKKYTNVDVSLVNIMKKTVSFLMWGFIVLMLLDQFGVNTASVLTVVGASALAIGIALKDTLSNIAAGIFLLCQHPYKTGDYVECAGTAGTIKDIGLFTTELQTPQGQDIAVPNNAIMGSPIINYSSNPIRRADIPISISYNDSIDKAVERLTNEMNDCTLVLQDPKPEVLVSKYADSGIELNLRYWTKNEDYWTAYWRFNHILQGVLTNEGITIPYPQVDVHFDNKDIQKDII